MHRSARLLLPLVGAAVLVASAPAPATSLGASEAKSYIVVLKDSVSDPGQVSDQHRGRYGAQLRHVYRHALKGYAATIPNERVDDVRRDSRVDYVERDQTAHVIGQTLPWGIDKVDADASSTLAGNESGAVPNVNSYVIDTGIANHADLNVVGHVNFAGGKNTDCNGHGTHVAGSAAARDNTSDVVGVAPGAPLTGVKVLGCNGSGSYSGVIKGLDWVTANAKKPAVANMSLGGPPSQALDDAVVRSTTTSGVFYALAAGNDGADACNSSPARTGAGTTNGIATVAATDSLEREASWSNWGRCVDIWAPGVSILSTKRGGGTTTMSGTSMASPHAAGGAALWLSSNPSATPDGVETALTGSATATGTKSKDERPIMRLYVGGF